MQTYSTKIIELDKHDKDFAGFKWVLKAVDFEETRGIPAGKVIAIEKEAVVATDGHRLHIYTPEEIYPTGTFKVLLRQQYHLIFAHTEDVKFPDYRAVIPDYSKFKELDMLSPTESAYAYLVKNMPQCIGYTYFADVGYMKTMYISQEEGQAVVFEDYRKKALIMPMRI